MIIYPAIDLQNGKVVRLYKGDLTAPTVYNDDPAAQAAVFQNLGFRWLHVVDLDGARDGAPSDPSIVRSILKCVNIPVQLGGGIRTRAHIDHWLEAGVSRIILGTAAVKNPALVREACAAHPGKIAVGIDARDGRVAVEGWVSDSTMRAIDLAKSFEDVGVAAIIFTDIERDGTGLGLNMAGTVELARAVSIPVIASGGVGSMADLKAVKDASREGVSGVIVGKAYYEGYIDAKAALTLAAS